MNLLSCSLVYTRLHIGCACMQPTPDYESAIAFLAAYSSELGLAFERIDVSDCACDCACIFANVVSQSGWDARSQPS